jgi:hypothetical protein
MQWTQMLSFHIVCASNDLLLLSAGHGMLHIVPNALVIETWLLVAFRALLRFSDDVNKHSHTAVVPPSAEWRCFLVYSVILRSHQV